jgi:hypothetical protein
MTPPGVKPKKRPMTPPDQYTLSEKEHVTPIRTRLKGKMHLRDKLEFPITDRQDFAAESVPDSTAYRL